MVKVEGKKLIYACGIHDEIANDYDAFPGDDDDEVEVEEVDGDGYTLVLPSGATVGHRSLLRYYKQSLNPR